MSSSPERRARWDKLISLCANARPRNGKDGHEGELEATGKCGYPTDYYRPGEEPRPDPGSEDYQAVLESAAPSEEWFVKVRELLGDTGGPGSVLRLEGLYRRGVQSGIGWLNRKTPNREILRGLIWCAAALPRQEEMDALRQLASWSIENRTAQAATIGLALALTNSEHAAAALRMIELSAKRPSPKTRFGRFASHVELKAGISPETSAERFVPTCGLGADGTHRVVFDGKGAIEVRIEGSKGAVRYFNATGKEVAQPPAAVKRDHDQELADIRAAAKGLTQLLGSQRNRIESFFLHDRNWNI